MAVGFRKSLFGFNCDDVINYVKKLHSSFAEKEKDFKENIESLTLKVEKLNSQQEQLLNEKAELQAKIAEYDAKKAEMERLLENIGKLYLVAQTNAKAIMNNAEENSRITNEEINKNLAAIDDTHSSLEELRESIIATSQNFTREVDALMESLGEAKEKIAADNDAEISAKSEFNSVLESLTK